jgi:alpha-1,6-mannosyltransferase
MFFSPTSGGVRRYLLAKHLWLMGQSYLRHTLVVPGPATTGSAGAIVEFASPRIPFGAGYRCPWRLAALRRHLAGLEPDLIEAGDPYQIGWQVLRVADALRVPTVAFCHSDLAALVGSRAGKAAGSLAARYLRALYSGYDRVLAPSRIVAERLRAAGVSRVIVQPLGVDARVFCPDRRDPSLRSMLNLPERTRLLVFAGRLAREKNIPDLFAMIDRLGDPYHLLVIGGPRADRPARRVSVLPYERDPTRLAAWLATGDAVVHAGRCETFGLVALEALACGRPVVVYDAGALPEIVDQQVGAVASAPVPSALADAVGEVFASDPAALGSAGRRRVLEHFTWNQVFTRQLPHYAHLLNRASLFRDDRGHTEIELGAA